MAKGLGRGLGAFFEEDVEKVQEIASNKKKAEPKSQEKDYIDKVVELNILDVEPMLNQPRKTFDQDKLEELSESIKIHGVLQPILVVKMDNQYTIVAGERRWRASKMAGLKVIPAIVKDYTDTKKKQVALIENIQREDLNAVEVANAIKDLMEIDGYNIQEVAKITGKSLSTISNTMRLLKLPQDIINRLEERKLVEAQARALLALPDEKSQIELADRIFEEKLTVREVEALVYGRKNSTNPKKNTKKATKKQVTLQKIEKELEDFFATRVNISAGRNRGKIEIKYFSNEDLTRILEKLNIEL